MVGSRSLETLASPSERFENIYNNLFPFISFRSPGGWKFFFMKHSLEFQIVLTFSVNRIFKLQFFRNKYRINNNNNNNLAF